jgi:glutamine synthetase
MLMAGLDGVEKEYACPPPVEENVFEMPEATRKERGIETLPGSLLQAIDAAEGSELLRRTLGDHLFDSLLTNKKIEWANFRRQVTDYELQRYLPLL